jgi:xanthine dehydrogenase accessory factor
VEIGALTDAVELAAAREPFVLATVVWRRGPSSGRVGAKAVIRADGSISGWLGGACAEPTVVREAQAAMGDGQPRLLFLGRPDELDRRAEDGMVTVPMACESEGAVEVYLEPFLPKPRVVVIGRSPAVFTLTSLALTLEWDVVVVDDGGQPTDHPQPALVRTTLDLGDLGVDGPTAVVVATQGHYDDLALEAALATGAGYIGVISSAKRAAGTFELLRGRGVTEEQLGRVTAPAGLDLGAVDNAEIAVAVLAELVARRAAGLLAAAPPASIAAIEDSPVERDPVCGMAVDPAQAKYRATHDGIDYVFCAAGCKATFESHPTSYASTPPR